MRILFVIPELSVGGSERQVALLAGALQREGCAVRIAALRAARRPLPLAPELDVRVLRAPRPHDPRCLPPLWRAMRAFRPDVVHTFLFGFDLWANVAARLLGVRAIVSSRRELATWQQARHRRWQNAANRLVDAVVANSETAAAYAHAHERHLDRGAYYAVPNACAPPRPPAADGPPLPPASGRTVVCIANFWPGKGHARLLEAFAVLRASADVSLWLVGEGGEEAGLRARADALGLAGHVHFLGRRDDVAAVLARADLCVHAAEMESSPNAILEAMGAGVPVAAVACGGVPELLEGGELGALVPRGDMGALARAMLRALTQRDEAAARAARAQAAVAARHAPAAVARQLLDIYRRVARPPRRSADAPAARAPSVALYTVGDVRHPSTRYRVLQFVPALQAAGFRVAHFGLPRPPARRVAGTLALAADAWRRRRQLVAAAGFDHVLVQKALTPSRWRGLPVRLTAAAPDYVLDLDDDVLGGAGCLPFRAPLGQMQNPREAVMLAAGAARVVAGNAALAQACTGLNPAVVAIPTVVDTARYWCSAGAGDRAPGEPFRLVWAGQRSTLPYLVAILPWLQAAAGELRGEAELVLRIVCDGFADLPSRQLAPLRIEFVPWRLDTEIDDLVGAHAGLMPLRDDAWCRGKCGFKALQVMALGIPAIVTPVGASAAIVTHGVDGLHARGREEWIGAIATLVRDEARRRDMGRRARARVVTGYSLQRWAVAWVHAVTG